MDPSLSASLEQSIEPSLEALAGWSGVVNGFAANASLVLLVISGLLFVLLVLTTIFPPPDLPRTAAEARAVVVLAGVGARVAPVEQERAPVAAGSAVQRAAETASDPLTSMEVAALFSLRERIQRGELDEHPLSPERLAFSRWLIRQGKLLG